MNSNIESSPASSRLCQRIDERLQEVVADVLVRAAENVGECTYAANIGQYLGARKNLMRVYRHWGSMPSRMFTSDENWWYSRMIHHHREMYRQPCLICDACRSRVKTWGKAAYTMFGESRCDDDREPTKIPLSVHMPGPYFVDHAGID